MKSVKLSNKNYLTAFVFVMMLNICLGIFLIRNVLAQTSDNTIKNQPSIVAEVVKQEDSPLQITILNVDNSESLFQVVNYAIQNNSNKLILAYTLLGNSKTSGKVSTSYFGNKLFQPNEFVNHDLGIERVNLKTDDLISLSIDYVLFDDGSYWGADIQKESERIAGNFSGKKRAIDDLKFLIDDKRIDKVENILKKEVADISTPTIDSKESIKWQSGFHQGYKSVLAQLKFTYEKEGASSISLKLKEMRKFLQMEEK